MDSWTDYNEIEDYLLKRGYTKEQIKEEFIKTDKITDEENK